MSESYEEILEGETLRRVAPGSRHETICQLLHERVATALNGIATTKLLPPRCIVQVSPGTMLRPDLALITSATRKVWLAAEIVDSHDHRADTVVKKQLYEDVKLPRLWMIDPRYDNVEVYHGTPYGLALQRILAGQELLTEALIPELRVAVRDLFQR